MGAAMARAAVATTTRTARPSNVFDQRGNSAIVVHDSPGTSYASRRRANEAPRLDSDSDRCSIHRSLTSLLMPLLLRARRAVHGSFQWTCTVTGTPCSGADALRREHRALVGTPIRTWRACRTGHARRNSTAFRPR